MAAGTALQVTSGSGPYLSLGPTYSEGGHTVADQKVILGEPYLPTYIVDSGGSIVVPSAVAKAWYVLMAGASLNVRVRRLFIAQTTNATVGGAYEVGLYRATTAPVGGTGQSANPYDTTDPAAGASAKYVSATTFTTDPTLGARIGLFTVPAMSAAPYNPPLIIEWGHVPGSKPLIIPAGTANGLVLHYLAAGGVTGSPGFTVAFEFVETPF